MCGIHYEENLWWVGNGYGYGYGYGYGNGKVALHGTIVPLLLQWD